MFHEMTTTDANKKPKTNTCWVKSLALTRIANAPIFLAISSRLNSRHLLFPCAPAPVPLCPYFLGASVVFICISLRGVPSLPPSRPHHCRLRSCYVCFAPTTLMRSTLYCNAAGGLENILDRCYPLPTRWVTFGGPYGAERDRNSGALNLRGGGSRRHRSANGGGSATDTRAVAVPTVIGRVLWGVETKRQSNQRVEWYRGHTVARMTVVTPTGTGDVS